MVICLFMSHHWTRWIIPNYVIRISYKWLETLFLRLIHQFVYHLYCQAICLSACLPAVCPSVRTSFISPFLPRAILTRAVFITAQKSSHVTSSAFRYHESLSQVSHSGDIMEDIRSQHGTGALTWQTLYQWLSACFRLTSGQEGHHHGATALNTVCGISITTCWKLRRFDIKNRKFDIIHQLL